MRIKSLFLCVALLVATLTGQTAQAQSFGIELHNNLMPASAGVAGTSLTRPLDLQSAINGNPATMTQFRGPTFGFGGTFIEPTYNVAHGQPLPLVGVTPYSGKSDAPATLLGNIGVINEVDIADVPLMYGLGFFGNAGLASDFRHIPESNGTHAAYVALDLVASSAIMLTDSLSVGGSFALGTSTLDGPFVTSSSAQTDYGVRFKVGANYDLGAGYSVGGFWESQKKFVFDNVVRFDSGPTAGEFMDLSISHPSNFGFGIANRCLMNGKLLVAADAIHKNWNDTDFFGAIYQNQWAFNLGSQYSVNDRFRLRAGYGYNEDATRDTVPGSIGGVIPVGGIPTVQYIQGQFAAIAQHRLTGGVGISNLLPNTSFDASVGGVLPAEKSFGDVTTAKLKGYYISFGFTFVPPARN